MTSVFALSWSHEIAWAIIKITIGSFLMDKKTTVSASCKLEFETIWMEKSRQEFVDERTLDKKLIDKLWRFFSLQWIFNFRRIYWHITWVQWTFRISNYCHQCSSRLVYLLSSFSSMASAQRKQYTMAHLDWRDQYRLLLFVRVRRELHKNNSLREY